MLRFLKIVFTLIFIGIPKVNAQLFGGQLKNSLVSRYQIATVFCTSGPTAIVDVTNPTTGKIWMDRNLGATQAATSSTAAASYGDLYQWGRRADGHQCRTSATTATLSSSDQPAHGNFILAPSSPFDWRSPQNVNLWQGVNGVNNPCPSGYRIPTDTELDAERLSWSANTSVGAFASPLKLPMAGYRYYGSGSLGTVGTGGYYWSSSVSGTYSRYLMFYSSNAFMDTELRARGYSVRCIKETVATLGALNCGSAASTGNLINGQAATGVTISVPYTGGNGGYYSSQSIQSSGIAGLTASLNSGLLANGTGNLVYTISGTPATSGIASFSVTIGGQSCSFTVNVTTLVSQYPAGSVFCASGPTAIVDVINPTTGRTWMDRNLGASQVATSSTDAAAYGDLYQWGRRADGHQCRTSATTVTLSSIDQPTNGNFIITNSMNWRSPTNVNLWQGVNGVNNPCPSGYRLPTDTELNTERLSWSPTHSSGAFASPLKWTSAGGRENTGSLFNQSGQSGRYWSSTSSSGNSALFLEMASGTSGINEEDKVFGFSVRCIKN